MITHAIPLLRALKNSNLNPTRQKHALPAIDFLCQEGRYYFVIESISSLSRSLHHRRSFRVRVDDFLQTHGLELFIAGEELVGALARHNDLNVL